MYQSCAQVGVEYTIERVSVFYIESRVVKPIVGDLAIHAAANIIEPFVQPFVVLQEASFLDSGFLSWFYVQGYTDTISGVSAISERGSLKSSRALRPF